MSIALRQSLVRNLPTHRELRFLDIFYCCTLPGTSKRCSWLNLLSIYLSSLMNVVHSRSILPPRVSPWGHSEPVGHLCRLWERERERDSGGECSCLCVCVRSCSLVCLVQNWFKAPGHRKKATLHSRHVPETSSRGSTIAIQQRRLQTPKWVCSVLQCPTWQSATYSAPLAPNIPSPSCCYFHSLL